MNKPVPASPAQKIEFQKADNSMSSASFGTHIREAIEIVKEMASPAQISDEPTEVCVCGHLRMHHHGLGCARSTPEGECSCSEFRAQQPDTCEHCNMTYAKHFGGICATPEGKWFKAKPARSRLEPVEAPKKIDGARVMCADHEWLDEKPCPFCANRNALKKANAGFEEYERKFYLESDKVERLKELLEDCGEFVDSHSEAWYLRGQDLLNKIKSELDLPEPVEAVSTTPNYVHNEFILATLEDPDAGMTKVSTPLPQQRKDGHSALKPDGNGGFEKFDPHPALPQQKEPATPRDIHGLVVTWDAEDKIFVCMIPEAGGCTGHGDTREVAIAMCEDNLRELLQWKAEGPTQSAEPIAPLLGQDEPRHSVQVTYEGVKAVANCTCGWFVAETGMVGAGGFVHGVAAEHLSISEKLTQALTSLAAAQKELEGYKDVHRATSKAAHRSLGSALGLPTVVSDWVNRAKLAEASLAALRERNKTQSYTILEYQEDKIAADAFLAAKESELIDAQHEFKNFHERLCERFGYPHDVLDWKRDQVSLIEYIYGEIKTVEASLAEAQTRISELGKDK